MTAGLSRMRIQVAAPLKAGTKHEFLLCAMTPLMRELQIRHIVPGVPPADFAAGAGIWFCQAGVLRVLVDRDGCPKDVTETLNRTCRHLQTAARSAFHSRWSDMDSKFAQYHDVTRVYANTQAEHAVESARASSKTAIHCFDRLPLLEMEEAGVDSPRP